MAASSRRAAGAPHPRTPATGGTGPALYAAAMADTETFDPLETPRCPNHPTVRLTDVGTAPDGHDARWQYPVEGCTYTQLA